MNTHSAAHDTGRDPVPPARYGPKPPVRGSGGMVVTSHPLATRAAREVLRDGGNATDAALTAAATQLIVEPHMTSLTGGLSLLHRSAATGATRYVNGNVAAPLAPLPDFSGADLTRGRGVPVPGWWPAFEEARRRFGTLGRARLLAPALAAATDGFEVNPFLYGVAYGEQAHLGASEQMREVFFEEGHLAVPGQTIRQPRAARTLERLRDEGMDYYLGDFARAVAATARADGGVLHERDFAAYRVHVQEPVRGTYRGAEIVASPPPDDGGVQLICALNMLETVELPRMGPPTADPETLRLLIQAHNAAYYAPPLQYGLEEDRTRLEVLLSKEYARTRTALLATPPPSNATPTPGTIHISVVDAAGDTVSLTHSHMCSGFVNGLFSEGFQLSGGGSFFQRVMPQPGEHASVYLAPNLVLRDGRPVLVSGSPSVSLVANVLQNVVNILDFGMTIEESVHAPRFGARPHSPERGWQPGNLLEAGFDKDVLEQTRAWAHRERLWTRVVNPWNALTGNFEGICLDRATGEAHACADPRRVGSAEAA
ncbi:gamma-glutamyltransferase [Streptomyces reniochalinae]|uniref:Gamma-glutamyltransferase n=1 Tax=Streptomyces reniochalinae TaxID=2250578 RepID=A0A367EM67_9ACTN|nr:gamma-glutamyltransferase [Streptomyces reniochalinae]RCG18695.1 gamma-glutamyltransferase [Streptomyces reniochalinae]